TYYVRRARYPAASARRDLADLQALALRVTPTEPLAEAALEIALTERLTGTEAFYVALAEHVQAPLITADARLLRALRGKPYPVLSLAEFGSGERS
ncbi:MAG: type II toxin-antitoxin system VapC family toxin, partial [Anaerolineales bacterium]|nr:type II toxin-antitoxin system VapC family toxin [Anaerolineales bacterium]